MTKKKKKRASRKKIKRYRVKNKYKKKNIQRGGSFFSKGIISLFKMVKRKSRQERI